MLWCSVPFKVMKFPCGEPHVTLDSRPTYSNDVDVIFEFESVDEIIQLMLLVDAVKSDDLTLNVLSLPYVPFSRQDRIANPGESFSLRVFCDLVNGFGFKSVYVQDPHSDVTTALLKNVLVTHQHQIFRSIIANHPRPYWLISPDGGALKKIYKLAAETSPLGVIECSKLRDTKTGQITETKVHATDLGGHDCFIVDDICDGGGTFIEIAKKLKELNAGKIHLLVTHGFFTKGLEVFNGLIDQIHTSKGRAK